MSTYEEIVEQDRLTQHAIKRLFDAGHRMMSSGSTLADVQAVREAEAAAMNEIQVEISLLERTRTFLHEVLSTAQRREMVLNTPAYQRGPPFLPTTAPSEPVMPPSLPYRPGPPPVRQGVGPACGCGAPEPHTHLKLGSRMREIPLKEEDRDYGRYKAPSPPNPQRREEWLRKHGGK
jgi:hypothetical protein